MALKIDGSPLVVTDGDLKVVRMARLVGRVRGRGFRARLSTVLRARVRKADTLGDADVAPINRRIRIIYRHVAYSDDRARFPLKNRPPEFSYAKCLRNLLATIQDSPFSNNVSLHLYYNGTTSQFAADDTVRPLEAYKGDCEVRFVEAGSALEAYLVMLRAVRDSKYSGGDLLYLLENDYLHQHGWVDEVMALLDARINFDYLSLYDHPDRYKIPDRYKKSKLYATSTHHWVTAPSTCASFLLPYATFVRDFNGFYTHKVDHRIFTYLIRGCGRILLTPVPGLATHCMNEHLDFVNRLEHFLIDQQCSDES